MEKLCIKLNRELGLLVSSIDFVQHKNGGLFFLEVNPIGDWYWIEKHMLEDENFEDINLSLGDIFDPKNHQDVVNGKMDEEAFRYAVYRPVKRLVHR